MTYVLNKFHICPNNLNAMIGSITRELTISYSDKDLMKKGKYHNDPLHITVDAKDKRIPMVPIDNGCSFVAVIIFHISLSRPEMIRISACMFGSWFLGSRMFGKRHLYKYHKEQGAKTSAQTQRRKKT